MAPSVQTRSNNIAIGAVRIVAGLLWLANLDFGRSQKNGLYKHVDGAVAHRVFAPWSGSSSTW